MFGFVEGITRLNMYLPRRNRKVGK